MNQISWYLKSGISSYAASWTRALLRMLLCGVALAILGGCAGLKSNVEDEHMTLSDRTDDQKRARIRLQLAIGYYQQAQYEIALDEVKKALQVDSELADAQGMRALIYMETGEVRLADESFQRALKLQPNNPDLLNNYGWFLCQNQREVQSLSYFEQALAQPTYAAADKAAANAGVCSLRLAQSTPSAQANHLEKAERYFLKAFQIQPLNPIANLELAQIYYKRKDIENARFYVNRVLSIQASAPAYWLAIRIERRLGETNNETALANQLRRRYPASAEWSAYQRGAFDE